MFLGVLLADEIKLSESIHFDHDTMKFHGFTDLGKYTPNHQADVRGDHALVLMYQPYCGKWVQPLAAFLSKGCASSEVLHNILLESVILVENSGFKVDMITTDGAQWNRAMWTKFGLKKHDTHCIHLCDENRKLWFNSDWSHLAKNFRNFVLHKDNFEIWV